MWHEIPEEFPSACVFVVGGSCVVFLLVLLRFDRPLRFVPPVVGAIISQHQNLVHISLILNSYRELATCYKKLKLLKHFYIK